MAAELTTAQAGEALTFAEAHSKLQIFLDNREDDPTYSIKGCFPPADSLSEARALKALYLLSRLNLDPEPEDKFAIFKIREKVVLFPSLAGATTRQLEDAKMMADYLHLPVRLVERVAAYLAILTLTEDLREGLAERLLEQADLQGLVQGGLKAILDFTEPLKLAGSLRARWCGYLDSSRLPFVRGLVGETLGKDAHDFEKAMQCCGRLFAGRELPYKLLPSHTELGGTPISSPLRLPLSKSYFFRSL
jgi:hypothetical protein